jgi:hypothetical protein
VLTADSGEAIGAWPPVKLRCTLYVGDAGSGGWPLGRGDGDTMLVEGGAVVCQW